MMTSSNGNIFRVTGHLCGNSPVTCDKGQWRGALMFSLICAWINGWVNNRDTCDLRRHRTHYDVTVMTWDRASRIRSKSFMTCTSHMFRLITSHPKRFIFIFGWEEALNQNLKKILSDKTVSCIYSSGFELLGYFIMVSLVSLCFVFIQIYTKTYSHNVCVLCVYW